MMFSPISCSLSPNVEAHDVWVACKMLFMPWIWFKNDAVRCVESWFSSRYPRYIHRSVNSGRSALYLILQAFDIGPGDEVIVQSFTCVAVPNAVLWVGATPIYADIDTRFNIDPLSIEKCISSKTKAIIIQNTFGIPAEVEKIAGIARKKKILLIEDCAHSLGAKYGSGAVVGSVGDASFFSFGRDKIISSVFGGVGSIDKKHASAVKKFLALHDQLPAPTVRWTLKQVFHPIAFACVLPLYRIGIGKILLTLLQKISFLSFPVYQEEKLGYRPTDFPKKYPNALATMLLSQIEKLERYNAARIEIASYYAKSLGKDFSSPGIVPGGVYLRYPILSSNRDEIIRRAKSLGILLGNWYSNILDPKGAVFKNLRFQKEMNPLSEEKAMRIINLPTRIPFEDAKKVAECLMEKL